MPNRSLAAHNLFIHHVSFSKCAIYSFINSIQHYILITTTLYIIFIYFSILLITRARAQPVSVRIYRGMIARGVIISNKYMIHWNDGPVCCCCSCHRNNWIIRGVETLSLYIALIRANHTAVSQLRSMSLGDARGNPPSPLVAICRGFAMQPDPLLFIYSVSRLCLSHSLVQTYTAAMLCVCEP